MFFPKSQVSLLALAALVLPSSSLPSGRHISVPKFGPICHDFFIQLEVTSQNRQFSEAVLTNTSSVGKELGALKASGAPYVSVTRNISVSARYCEPEIKVLGREKAIQVLVHGITYDKEYWSALDYQPGNYSWVDFASKNGYATLAIDRPGNGKSSIINPFTEAQIPFYAAMLKDIADGLRSKKWIPRCFDKLVYIGHSLGSAIGTAVATSYPDSYDAVVLTGFSKEVSGVLIPFGKVVPASTFAPRFANLSTGYVVTSSEDGRAEFMYGAIGTYDPAIIKLDYNQQGVAALGELATITSSVASNYTGPVAVVTGQQDVAFCYANATVLGDCGQGNTSLPAQVQSLFPNASTFDYYIPTEAGHDLNYHYDAHATFTYVHDWLRSNLF
ncbi:alpha beta-hydrolase [Ophiostoma piceae UAMH 11346]|uniref:Alpha beta-hydrolase n=1 Tax=Ophiostoma piceae (strain UAMH 11346) TaxID=1262450 RepID=S3C8E7_OPHP1|nr:alpha beta-hydrolase [Ophiostoma piceae UAMH 11346]